MLTAEAGVRQIEGRIGPLADAVRLRDVFGMTDGTDIRPDALRLVEQLSADARWDHLASEVYVRQAITQGLADADAGRTFAIGVAMVIVLLSALFVYFFKARTDRTVHVVISRYNEDIEWLKEQPFSRYEQIVYEKGDKKLSSSIALDNVGREGHTYLYHIVQNYDKLPDILVFLPGSAMDTNVYNKRDRTMQVMKSLGTTSSCRSTHGDHFNSVRNFSKEKYASTNKGNFEKDGSVEMKPASIRPFGKWLDNKFPGIDKLPNVWYHGIFSVTREQVLRNPKQFYVELLGEIGIHKNPEVGHYLERAWVPIFCGR